MNILQFQVVLIIIWMVQWEWVNFVDALICNTECLSCVGYICTRCKSEYFISNISNDCVPCKIGCSQCTSIDNCQTCVDPNHTLDEAFECICNSGYISVLNTCTKCTAPCQTCVNVQTKCLSCTHSIMTLQNNICKCPLGYMLQNQDCIQCEANCIHCDNQCCIECRDGYYSQGIYCGFCELPCQTCNNSAFQCKSCLDIRQMLIEDTCICQPGYYTLQNMCDQCNLPCVECVLSRDKCTQCIDYNHIVIDQSCVCRTGYLENGLQCIPCQSPCAVCIDIVTKCTLCTDTIVFDLKENICYCKPGFISNSNYYCDACVPPCQSCQGTVNNCTSCVDDNVYNLIDNKCQCKHGFVNQDNYCVQCGVQCLTCQYSSDNCTSCTSLNHKLNLNNECICDIGYVQQANQCVKCQQQCFSCLIQSDICTSCNIGYYLDNYQCHQCDLTCSICQAQTICSQCIQGYYLNNQLCYKCSVNCKQCIIDTECQQCDSNYYNDGNICLLCEFPCRTCKQLTTKCLTCVDSIHQLHSNQCKCKDKYYQLDTGHCIECPIHCLTCTLNTCLTCQDTCSECDWNGCKKCKESNYFINSQVCSICPFPCLTCDILTCFTCQLPCLKCNHQECLNCQDGYKVVNGRCLDCSSEFGMMLKECNYSNCSDGKWTMEEECDDGNSIQRDGCSNCKVDPGYSCINKLFKSSVCYKCQINCQQCSQLNLETQCTQCQVGYYLFNGSCERCHDSCQVCSSLSQCLICSVEQLAPINGKCQECLNSQGMYLNEQFECLPKCGDYIQTATEECDDGNLLNNDGCSDQCIIEKRFDCSQGTCEQIIADEKISLQYLDQTTKNIIVLRCDIPIDCQSIKVRIEQFTETEFEFQVLLIEEQQCQIDFTFKKTITEMNLIHLSFQTYESGRILNEENIREVIIVPRKEIYATESQRDMAVQAVAAQDKLGTTLYVVAPMAILIGGLNVFMSILDIMTWINNLYFINVYYPENANQVFVNSIWGQTNEIASPFILNDINDDYYLASPPRFLEKGVDSMFINNVWLSAYMLIAVVLAYTICRSLNWLIDSITKKNQIIKRVNQIVTVVPPQNIKKSKYKQLVNSVQNKLQSYCQTIGSTLVTMINLSLLDFTMASVLQISVAKKYNPNQPILFVNIILALFTIICILITIQLAYNVSTKAAKQLKSQTYNLYYGSFYKHINVESRIGRLYSVCNLLRKVLFIVSLIVFYDIPLMQVYFCGIVTFSNVALIIWENPFISIRHLIQYGVPDVCLFVLLMICSLLAVDDKISYLNSDQRFTIGWIIISLICVSIATQVYFMLQEWYINFKEYAVKLQEYCNKQKKSRVGSADII